MAFQTRLQIIFLKPNLGFLPKAQHICKTWIVQLVWQRIVTFFFLTAALKGESALRSENMKVFALGLPVGSHRDSTKSFAGNAKVFWRILKIPLISIWPLISRLIDPTQEIFRFQWILFSFLFTNWVWIWRWNAPNASLNTLISSLWMRFNFSANLPLCFAKVQLSTLRSRDIFLPIF